jgi:hypothetical protein
MTETSSAIVVNPEGGRLSRKNVADHEIKVAGAGRYLITVSSAEAVIITLIDQDGITVAADGDPGPGASAWISAPLAPGSYTLRVTTRNPAPTTEYTVTAKVDDKADEREALDNPTDDPKGRGERPGPDAPLSEEELAEGGRSHPDPADWESSGHQIGPTAAGPI